FLGCLDLRSLANFMMGREIHWKWAGGEIAVRIEETRDRGTAQIGDRTVTFLLHSRDSNAGWVGVEGRNRQFYLHRHRDEVTVWIDGQTYRLTKVQKGQTTEQGTVTTSGELRALMPGKILRVDVAEGDIVSEKQTLVTMESMKMETA